MTEECHCTYTSEIYRLTCEHLATSKKRFWLTYLQLSLLHGSAEVKTNRQTFSMTSGMEVQHIYMSKLINFNTYSIYAMHAVDAGRVW